MSINAARDRIELERRAGTIPASVADDLLVLLESTDQTFAAAYRYRLHLQEVNDWPPHKAIAEAVRVFRPRVREDEVPKLQRAVKKPNGRITALAKNTFDKLSKMT